MLGCSTTQVEEQRASEGLQASEGLRAAVVLRAAAVLRAAVGALADRWRPIRHCAASRLDTTPAGPAGAALRGAGARRPAGQHRPGRPGDGRRPVLRPARPGLDRLRDRPPGRAPGPDTRVLPLLVGLRRSRDHQANCGSITKRSSISRVERASSGGIIISCSFSPGRTPTLFVRISGQSTLHSSMMPMLGMRGTKISPPCIVLKALRTKFTPCSSVIQNRVILVSVTGSSLQPSDTSRSK